MKYKVTGVKAKKVVKRAMYLAWRACGCPTGMGFLQDRPGATEEDVWLSVGTLGEVNADYVFGRMMKLSLRYTDDEIVAGLRGDPPQPDYQGWCCIYPSVLALLEAAAAEVGGKVT